MQKLFIYALLLAGLAACKKDEDTPVVPREDNHSLEVQVYYTPNWSPSQPAGSPALNATVQLFKTRESFNSNTPAYTQATDVNGKATFANIDTGLYYIVARLEGSDNLLGMKQQGDAYVGFVADSLYQTQVEAAAGPVSKYAAPGNFRLQDLNGDGIIDANDQTLLPAKSATVRSNEVSTARVLIGKMDNRPDLHFANKAEVNEVLQSAYAGLSKWHELQVTLDAVYTDDYGCNGLPAEWCTINSYTGINSANSTIANFWKSGFQIVSQLNRIIFYTNKLTGSEMSTAEKALAIRRAAGLKGYVYLQLFTYFGPVPRLDSVYMPANIASSTLTEVYGFTSRLLEGGAMYLGEDAMMPSAACRALSVRLDIQQRGFAFALTNCDMILSNTAYDLVDTPSIFTQARNKEIIWQPAASPETAPLQTVFNRGTFLPVVRLSEVQFMHAEINLEQGNVQTAVNSLNKLRQRENLAPIVYSADPGFVDAFRTELRAHYKRHMRLEGTRFATLKRWNALMPVLKPLGFEDYQEFLPIPQEILDSYPNIHQNRGY